jgi:hypothetical protein
MIPVIVDDLAFRVGCLPMAAFCLSAIDARSP